MSIALPTLVVAASAASSASPVLDVVVPVHNEEADLESCLRRLHAYLAAAFPFPFRITVAENASTDGTVAVARRIAAELPGIEVLALPDPGRGGALRTAWLASDAPVLAYMDVDLSTDLSALLPLVAPLISGHSDLAIGTRLQRSSRVVRGAKRELISRGYNLLLHLTRTTSVSDAQCGFKAIRSDVAERLLPLVEDDGWFFDTELLALAERLELRIHEVAVDWIDDPDSRVDIPRTARADLAGIARLRGSLIRGRLPLAELRAGMGRHPLADRIGRPATPIGQLLAFAAIGVVSTAAYVLLFLTVRDFGSAQLSNVVALLITAVANTAANRRLTFGVRGRSGAGRDQLRGLLVFAVGLVLTSGSLAVLHILVRTPPRPLEVGVLVTATIATTGLRFLLLRWWIFRSPRDTPRGPSVPSPRTPLAFVRA
jgi:putative flippase GtrA